MQGLMLSEFYGTRYKDCDFEGFLKSSRCFSVLAWVVLRFELKNKVGLVVIEALFSPLLDPAEPLMSELSKVDGKDDRDVREVFKKHVGAYFETFDARSQDVIADSIRYFSNLRESSDVLPMDALPTPFELRQTLDTICRWLLEDLGIDQSDAETGLVEYERTEDLALAHRLRRHASYRQG